MTKICSITDCSVEVVARGWCGKHYKRWSIYGDPLGKAPERPRECKERGCSGEVKGYGWCGKHYTRWKTHGDPNKVIYHRGSIEERFWAKVDKGSSPKGCWEWTGGKDRAGYGKLSYHDRNLMAHRISYKLHNNVDLERLESIHHTCANTGCVNPEHLQHVSERENLAEMRERRYYKTRIAYLETLLKTHGIEY